LAAKFNHGAQLPSPVEARNAQPAWLGSKRKTRLA
jgi:hypothetical protein